MNGSVPRPKGTALNFHGPLVAPAAGCSHQPLPWMMSALPSPLMSP
jgi:hypothetical protein